MIVSAVRTPIGSIGGSLASVQAPDLGATAIKGAVERAGVDPAVVQETYFGNVISAGMGQAPARQATLKGGEITRDRGRTGTVMQLYGNSVPQD